MLEKGYIAFDAEHHHLEKAITLTERGRTYTDKLLWKIYTAEEKAITDTMEHFSSEFINALEYFAESLQKSMHDTEQPS